MLTDFRSKISIAEGFLIAWIFTIIIDEAVQLITDHASLHGYFSNLWNILDVTALITYFIGFILRCIYHGSPDICPECLYVARLLISLSLIMFYLRILQAFYINKTLGPKVYMMRRLFRDLLGFLLILAVFVMAYGVVSNVVMYPNQPLSPDLLVDVLYDAWWSVIQQFDREESLGEYCVANPTTQVTQDYCSSSQIPDVRYEDCKAQQCPANTWFVPILMFVYAVVIVVMMLNILIAMFNVTFSAVNEKSVEVFKMQRYRIIREFSYSRTLPPPLSVLYLIKYFWSCLKCCKDYCISDDENSDDENSDDDDSKSSRRNSKDKSRDKSKPNRRNKLDRRTPKAFGKDIESDCYIWEHKMLEKYDEQSRHRDITFVAVNPEGVETNNSDPLDHVRLVLRSTAKQSLMEDSIQLLVMEVRRCGEKLSAFEGKCENLTKEIQEIKELADNKKKKKQKDTVEAKTGAENVEEKQTDGSVTKVSESGDTQN